MRQQPVLVTYLDEEKLVLDQLRPSSEFDALGCGEGEQLFGTGDIEQQELN